MEIEKKFLIKEFPENLEQYDFSVIEQGYLCSEPVVRIRRMDDKYILTCKARQESENENDVCVNREEEFFLSKKSYEHLKEKCDGYIIEKRRYRIPYEGYTIELDIFYGKYEGMRLAEVEFSSVEESEQFNAPEWFGKNVSGDYHYRNAFLALNS